jgi:hypothetical protein
LALQVCGHREDFQPVRLGHCHALCGVFRRARIGIALAQVKFPGGILPAIEPGLLDELDPLAKFDIAELTANKADLVVGSFARAVLGSLIVTHGHILSGRNEW